MDRKCDLKNWHWHWKCYILRHLAISIMVIFFLPVFPTVQLLFLIEAQCGAEKSGTLALKVGKIALKWHLKQLSSPN
jgi:hypothetical protein